MKSVDVILMFCLVQLIFMFSLPFLFQYDFKPEGIAVVTDLTREDAIAALQAAHEKEQHLRSAISKMYKGLLIEVSLLLALALYAKRKIRNTEERSNV